MTRCPDCGLPIVGEHARARCQNARRLQMTLSAAGAIPRACDQNTHLRYKASAETFLLNTTAWQYHDTGEEIHIYGNCRRCSSTLAMYVRNSDTRLELAREALKGE